MAAVSWPGVEFVRDLGEPCWGVDGEVAVLGEVLAQQTVCVLVAAALPGRVRLAKFPRGNQSSTRAMVALDKRY